MSKVSVEDTISAFDVLARYCWYVDEGDGEAWAALWTPDGVFAGATPEPIRGHEALKKIPETSLRAGARHKHANLFADYGESADDLIVRGYNLVTSWLNDPKMTSIGVARYHLVRRGDTWKIKSKSTRMIVSKDFPTDGMPDGFPLPADQPSRWPPLT